jgi:Protein of unknown function (DUF2793)
MAVSFGPKIPSAFVSAAQGDNYYTAGEALLRTLQTLVQPNVISVGLNTPPVSPTNGNTYAVGSAPTGVWAAHANSIAYWSTDNPTVPTGEWEFYTPAAGWIIGNQTNNSVYIFNGSTWTPSVSFSGTIAANQIAFGSGTNTVTGSSALTFAGSTLTVGGAVQLGTSLTFNGSSSGSATIQVAATAGTPNPLQLPTTTGTAGQVLSTNGANPQQLSWTTLSVGSSAFSAITSGTNTTATMIVGSGASLTFSGTGVIEATELATSGSPVVVSAASPPSTGQVLTATSATAANWQTPSGGGSTAFSAITSSTNTTATMTVGPGSILTFSGAGSPPSEGEINANFIYGVQISATAPTTGQVLTSTGATSANWQTPASGGGGSYATNFSSITTFTVLGTTHGLGTPDVSVTVYDSATGLRNLILPNSVSVDTSTYNVTITFSFSQSGRVVIQK